jgi:hypothetical protein
LIAALSEVKSYLQIDQTDTSQDIALQLLLDSTEEEIRTFCHKHDKPETVGDDGVIPAVTYSFKPSTKLAQLKWIAKEHMNMRQGSNGIQSENVGGMSTTYIQGIPEDIIEKLYLDKKVVVI